MDKSNLPVVMGERNLTQTLKKSGIKAIKIAASSLGLLAFSAGFAASTIAMPVLAVPSMIAAIFSAQKLLNNTKYKSYKDLAFITGKHNGKTKIYQDVTRVDLTAKMKGMANIEKIAFMQLQTIIGLTKFNQLDKKGNEIIFETDSHRVNQKTFRKLQELGYIKEYDERFLRDSRLILPKLAFGNVKGFKNKTGMYRINFKLTGKPLELEDKDLRRYFPMVFGEQNGIIAKCGYNFIKESDGSLTIDYKPQTPYIERKIFPVKRQKSLQEKLFYGLQKKERPSMIASKENANRTNGIETRER